VAAERMSIGEFARATGLSAKALRLYDEMRLVVPVEVDPASGYRRYGPEQLDGARLVAQLRLAGMPLARIRVVAELEPAAAAAELTSYARELAAQAAATCQRVESLVRDLAPRPGKEHEMSGTFEDTRHDVDTGVRHEQGGREAQLDAFHAGPDVYAVADGFGDDPDAAARAITALVSSLGAERTLEALDRAVAATATVMLDAEEGSGCTLSAIVLAGCECLVAHIGDSRIYRVRAGRLEQLTRDHSVVQFLVDEGRLTPEEARLDDQRPVLHRALAPEPHGSAEAGAPDLAVHRVEPGDRIVLTTDGAHARLDAATLAGLVLADQAAQQVADEVAAAVESGGADDNFTIVVVDLT
jgi:PPM family protein phosphatase